MGLISVIKGLWEAGATLPISAVTAAIQQRKRKSRHHVASAWQDRLDGPGHSEGDEGEEEAVVHLSAWGYRSVYLRHWEEAVTDAAAHWVGRSFEHFPLVQSQMCHLRTTPPCPENGTLSGHAARVLGSKRQRGWKHSFIKLLPAGWCLNQ